MVKNKKIIAILLTFILISSSVIYFVYSMSTSKYTSLLSNESDKTANYDSIFKKDSVIDIKIDVSEEDWKNILDNPTAEEYKSATVTVNGTTLSNVGFRTKGNSTLKSVANSDSDRFSFRIKTDEYVDGQKLLGLDEFVLNNMYSDPSYLREYLSYEALEELGEATPKRVFANIYVNGKLQGLYLCIEAIDDSFLERNFDESSGNLYKQEQGSNLKYVENSNYESSEQKSGKDETKTDLKNFIKVLNEMPDGEKGNIESVLDVDSALKYIAANTVLGSYDSYSGNMSHNYYLYSQKGKFTVIPWDYNMSIGGFGMGGDATTIPIDEPVMGSDIKNLPLINNLLLVDEYKTKYHEYINELLDYLEGFENRVTEVSNIIRPYIEADPTKFYTMEQFEANIKYSETTTSTNSGQNQQYTNNNAPVSKQNTDVIVNPDVNANQNQTTQGQQPQFPQRNQNQLGGNANRNRQLPPQDMQGGFPNMDGQALPPDMNGAVGNVNRQIPQGINGNMKGGPGGGMMGKNSISIINFIRSRVENIKKQLSGELPTTGNTTMNNARGGGNRPENNQIEK